MSRGAIYDIENMKTSFLRFWLFFILTLFTLSTNAQSNTTNEKSEQNSIDKVEIPIVVSPDAPPTFKGGEDGLKAYLSANLKYPIVSRENGEQGRVIISAIIEIDGSLSNVMVEKSVSPSLDKEAKRLVSNMPNWIPGMVNDEPVRTKCLIPISFRLTD